MEKIMEKKERVKAKVNIIGNIIISTFHYLGLFVILSVVIWSSFKEVYDIFATGDASIASVLLLFIYLELGAMVGIYFKTNHLPIRFLLYIGITALTRHLISIIANEADDEKKIIFYCGGVLLLSLCVLVIRYASYKFPSLSVQEGSHENKQSEPD